MQGSILGELRTHRKEQEKQEQKGDNKIGVKEILAAATNTKRQGFCKEENFEKDK